MFRWVNLLGLGLFLSVMVSGTPAWAQAGELKRLRALLVFDSDSNLKDSVEIDKNRVLNLLTRTIPRERYEVTTLEGKDVTPEKILAYYRNLKTDSSEALLFYYGGHGAYDPQKGHYLLLGANQEKQLFRSDLQQAMERKRAGLVVLVTDCCSSFLPLARRRSVSRNLDTSASQVAPVVRSLFFQHRGLVDITAALEKTASWGDDEQGGIFTRTFVNLLSGDLATLDANHDGFLSWQEFFPKLEQHTEATFITWAKTQQARGEKITQESQKPRAFHLEARSAADARVYAVVSLRNSKAVASTYKFRWGDETSWQTASIPPGGKSFHAKSLAAAGATLPALFLEFDDGDKAELASREWIGDTPTYDSGAKYVIEKK